jgi:acyl carrier protein
VTQQPAPSEITDWLTGRLAALLQIPATDIEPAVPLDALGVTSMEEVIITADLEAQYALKLAVPDLRRHPSIEALAAHISLLAAGRRAGAALPQ